MAPYWKFLEAQAGNLGATPYIDLHCKFQLSAFIRNTFFSWVATSQLNCYGFGFFCELKSEKVASSKCKHFLSSRNYVGASAWHSPQFKYSMQLFLFSADVYWSGNSAERETDTCACIIDDVRRHKQLLNWLTADPDVISCHLWCTHKFKKTENTLDTQNADVTSQPPGPSAMVLPSCGCFPTFLRGIWRGWRETGLNDTSQKLPPFVTDGSLQPWMETWRSTGARSCFSPHALRRFWSCCT